MSQTEGRGRQENGEEKPRMGLGLKIEGITCAVVLAGLIAATVYIVKKYSDFVNYGGYYFGDLQGIYGLNKGLPFIPGRMVDLGDDSYLRRRGMIADGMIFWLIGCAGLKQMMRRLSPKYEKPMLAIFYILYACYYHRGAKILVLIFYVVANYYISKWTAGTKYGHWFVWGYNLIWLFCGKRRSFRRWMIKHSKAPIWGMGNLHLKFPLWNMNMKNISYGLDHHWARLGKPKQNPNVPRDHPEIEYKERIDTHLPLDCYSDIWTYLQFQFYPALYTEGPIITFNDFSSQYNGLKPNGIKRKEVLWYGLRVLLIYALVEYALHYLYVDAMLKTGYFKYLLGSASQFTAMDQKPVLGSLGLLMLYSMGFQMYYLKSLVEWKWGRLWSMVDGINPPDDFPQCITRSKTMAEIWKNWHASINKWCIRYIYIPFGGGRGTSVTKGRAIVLVFSFMALWHNIDASFLFWGIAIPTFIILEMLARNIPGIMGPARDISRAPRRQQQRSEWSERLNDALCVVPVLGFTIINMVTFVFGIDNIPAMVAALTTELSGWMMILSGMYCNHRCWNLFELWRQSKSGKKLHYN